MFKSELCKDSMHVVAYCSSMVKLAIVRCRYFYLPREIANILLVTVCILPTANIHDDLFAAFVILVVFSRVLCDFKHLVVWLGYL